MDTSTLILLTLIGYKLLLLGIGFWASRRVKTEGDFFLAGQGLGAFTAGLSYAASTSSAWVLLGFTGLVFTQGVVGLWLIPGIFSGYALTWFVMGPYLNKRTRETGYITSVDMVTDGMEALWKRRTGTLSALLILFCFIFYISSQFQAAGNALTSVFGIHAQEAIILGAVVILIYCLLGGFWAASITDALQACVMLLACILVPLATLNAAGGFESVIIALHAQEEAQFFALGGGAPGMLGVGVAMGLLGTGLGALGQPQLLNRIMAVKSAAHRRRAAVITIGWGAVIYSGLVILAFSARALQLETGGESLFFVAAETYLPAVVAGLVIAAVLSAVMSTVDSLLLAAASAVSHDMGITYTSPDRALLFGRLAMAAIAVLAVFMTLYLPKDIFSRVLFSWVALGAAFGPTLLTRCLGWRIKPAHIFFAILTGFAIAVISANVTGVPADVIEKWGSWSVGLVILWIGRQQKQKGA